MSYARAYFLVAALYAPLTVLGASGAQPWLDITRSPEQRMTLALNQMTLDEKLAMLHGPMALNFLKVVPLPPEAVPGAGYIPGVPRLHIPSLRETDASLGVTNPGASRPGDIATAMPSGLALAASFDPQLAYRFGSVVGQEAHAKGFDVLLGGGVNLARDPRSGRNFEYLGEDPLLAGTLVGADVKGVQDNHVISTVKHFVLNDQETNRSTLDAQIDRAALRESDLLAFELAIEGGHPGSVMCSYNLVNGEHTCGNAWLLDEVLKKEWGFPGWVMSDWGAVHSLDYASKGLDQESGEQMDSEVWFKDPLKAAVLAGTIPLSRINDMVSRILLAMFKVGVVDHPPAPASIDYAKNALVSLEAARDGIVLLKNEGGLLPIGKDVHRIAVIGGQSQIGVLSGGGSAQVTPSNGEVTKIPIGGQGPIALFRVQTYFPSAPAKELAARWHGGEVAYDSGYFPAEAAELAAHSDLAIVFATRHELEGFDIPNLTLPNGQDALISAVAAANPNVIVVLETGNPVAMPWLSSVKAVIEAWYPGQEGGRAIAEILEGEVNPSGRLPITFPIDDAHSIRPQLPNFGSEPKTPVTIRYEEGADVGYRWYQKHAIQPLFAFGHGLSYTSFRYGDLRLVGGKGLSATFDVTNVGSRPGADVPQIYLTEMASQKTYRLIGFQRVNLAPGASTKVTLKFDLRLAGHFDEMKARWVVPGGHYQIALTHESGGEALVAETTLRQRTVSAKKVTGISGE